MKQTAIAWIIGIIRVLAYLLDSSTSNNSWLPGFSASKFATSVVLASTFAESSSVVAAAEETTTCSADDGTCGANYDDEEDEDEDEDEDDEDEPCADQDERCGYWASIGECDKNPGYMLVSCQESCGTCPDSNSTKHMLDDAKLTEEDLHFGLDLGVKQSLQGQRYGIQSSKIEEVISSGRDYWRQVRGNYKPELRELCKNEHQHCALWVAQGECEANPTYMKRHCAPVCQSCDYLSIEGRCPLDPDAPEAWAPGDLDKMFTRLTSEPYLSKYDVKVLASPSVNNQPWVITMENVITEEQANILIELGDVEGYKRSADVGKLNADGTFGQKISETRTSMNAWCQHECYENATALEVAYHLSNLTGIPETNSEFLQLLRYEPGQYYRSHHDYIDLEFNRQQGPRILTLYLYLNEVEAGGGTNFDKLNVTVMPKLGRAVLWPSVLDNDPSKKDGRTSHQALPVEKGVKFGANAWFHLRDFKTPNRNHCM